MYHRILKSKGGAMRMYEIENGKPVRDAQFHVVPRAGDKFDMYDAEEELILENVRASTCEIKADDLVGGLQ